MATVTLSEARGPEPSGEPTGREADARAAAFCSPHLPDPFHAVAYASQVWTPDPFDVESIHRGARDVLRRIVGRVVQPSGLAVGRILLLLGEAGCGKTHLMRAFRNELHARGQGYVGYMQMTAYTDDYSRYVLNNLIESLDKPYDEPRSPTSGLMRLSNALAESGRDKGGVPGAADALDRLREAAPGQPGLDEWVRDLADRIALDPRFASIDYDLVQALLYLQAADPRVKARVLKYLRCEDLAPRDRQDLGGMVPRVYASAAQWMIQRLGELIWAVEKVPLVLCVDQLEDMFDQAEAPARFRRVLATLCDLTSRLPSAIVVISCLENFYDEVKRHLTAPISRRVTAAPGPVELPAACDRDQVIELIARRLESLYRSAGAQSIPAEPTYPLPDALVRRLVGLGARDVLEEVGRYRERCVAKGKMVAYPFDDGDVESATGAAARELDRKIVAIEQAWNEARSAPIVVPSDEVELATILAEAITSCTGELEAGAGGHFEADADGRFIQVERRGSENTVERMLVGICNRAPQGGALSRQIDEVVRRAGGSAPVIARSTAFPATAKSVVVQQLQKLVADGGRRAVVEDSEWRIMMALARFRSGRESEPVFTAWLGRTRPLTNLAALRAILGLDRPTESRPPGARRPA
jgi:Cdc6-like AAA superfamily ATPase